MWRDLISGPPMTAPELEGMLDTLQASVDRPMVPTSDHSTHSPIFMKDTESATHVYSKIDNPTGMMPRYTGPHKILERLSDSTLLLKVGTYSSGKVRTQVRHWSHCKPAYMREGSVEAEGAKLGRPKKSSVQIDAPPPASEAHSQLSITTNDSKQKEKEAPEPAKIQTRFPARSTRNKNPTYVDAIWSASESDLAEINASISRKA